MYVGGVIYGAVSGSVTTASNLAGGGPGRVVFQVNTGSTGFVSNGATGTVLISNYTAAPEWANSLTLDRLLISGTYPASSTITGALVVYGGAGVGENLYLGGDLDVAGQDITSPNSTFNILATVPTINIGASSGTAISIASTTGFTVVRNQFTITSTLDSSNTVTGSLQVRGGAAIARSLYAGGNVTIAGITDVINTTSATSTNTGALKVAGGAGVGGDLYVGGTIYGKVTDLAGGATGSIPYQAATGDTEFIPIGPVGYLLTSNGTTASWGPATGVVAGSAATATNLAGGAQYQIPYQTGVGLTGFESGFEYNYTSNTFSSTNATFNGTTNSVSTTTGAVTIVGGLGLGGNIVAGGNGRVGGQFTISSTASSISASSGALQVAGGIGVGGGINVSGISTISNDVTVGQSTYQFKFTIDGSIAALQGPNTSFKIQRGTTDTINADSSNVGILNHGFFVGPNTSSSVLLVPTTGTIIASLPAKITNNNNSTSTITGALVVTGGVGIGRDLYVGGTIYGNIPGLGGAATTISVSATNTNTVHYLTFVDSNNTTATQENLYTTSTIQIRPSTGEVDILSNLTSTSTTTGALVVSGGVGIAGDIFGGGSIDAVGSVKITSPTGAFGFLMDAVGVANAVNITHNGTDTYFFHYGALRLSPSGVSGNVRITNTTSAINTSSGALVVSGGVGIAGDLWVGGSINGSVSGGAGGVSTVQTNATTTHYLTFVDSNNAGPSTETVYTTASITVNPGTGEGIFLSTVNPTSTLTGALQVRGGAGIGRDLYVGGSIFGTITSATNLQGGTAGAVVIQTATNRTGFTAPGTGGDVFVSQGAVAGGPVFQNTLTLAGITSATSTASGALQVRGGVGVGGSMYLQGYLQVGYVNTTGYSTGTNGEIRATNEITAYYSSDLNLKENIQLIEQPLTLINQIRGVYFDWKDSFINYRGGEDGYFVRKHDVGVIAQEIEKVLPEIVATRPDGFKAVKYEKIVPLLIESIKELYKEIENLKKQIK